jgi:tripartite-type tricarboxylate transporter receptor subunit TctC
LKTSPAQAATLVRTCGQTAGDGYTMMITSIGMATNKPLYGKLNYDPIKDFAPVSLLAVVPNVLVTNATQPDVKTAGT